MNSCAVYEDGCCFVVAQAACVGHRWARTDCAKTWWWPSTCRRRNAASWAVAPWLRPGARTIWTTARCSSGGSWATACRALDAKVTVRKTGKSGKLGVAGEGGGVLVQLSTTGESRPFIPISLSELCPFRISKIIRIYNIYETGRSAGCKLRRFLIFPFFYGAFRLFRTNNTFGNFKRIPSERYNIETNDQKRLGKTECRFEVFRNSLSPWLFRTFPTSTPVPDLWSATTPEFFYPTSKVYFPVSRRIGDE